MILFAVKRGTVATFALLAGYAGVVTFVSGFDFAITQFLEYWYFIISLAIGFGIQIGCYAYLKKMSHRNGTSRGVVVGTGTTSTLAMISCCAHYLVTVIPALGVFGIASVVGKYQIEFFWIGIIFNGWGIIYLVGKIKRLVQKT